jgi:uncharacterized membrane protein YphA (DoxX/SURF4 family)
MRSELPMILVRAIVGLVFILEGLLKFLQPTVYGTSNFSALGLPFPHILAPLVGGVEIAGGLAVLFNFFAGDAALGLALVMLAALATTKMPILLGRSFGPFPFSPASGSGWLAFLHAARVDLAMLISSLAICIDSGLQMGRQRRWYQP